MAKIVVTKIIMDNGESLKVQSTPSEVIERFTDKDGKIRDEFIEEGLFYVNPKHVAFLCYVEEDKNEGPTMIP